MSPTDMLSKPRTETATDAIGLDSGFAKQLLSAMIAFRDGDFNSRLPTDLVGVPGKIADVFNEILSVSSRRAEETTRISRVVGKE